MPCAVPSSLSDLTKTPKLGVRETGSSSVTHFEAYVGFLTLVLTDAPDRWVKESFLKDEDQLDLEKAFTLLRDKFYLVEERIKNKDLIPDILALLEGAYVAYKAGENKKGAFLIQDFEELIIKATRRR